MRILPICLIAMAWMGCNKTSVSDPIPSFQDSLPKIASLYLPQSHVKGVEYFVYDDQLHLTTLRGYNYDSSSGTPAVDSLTIHYTLNADGLPTTFDETYYLQGDPPAGKSEHHELFYDAQNRLTLDSITASDVDDFSVQHFRYDNAGNTIIQWLSGDPATPGSYTVYQIDTMNIQSENLATDINYTASDGNFNYLYTRSYSSHLNPVYNAVRANGIGCYLVFNNSVIDFRSKYLPAQFNSQGNGIPSFTLNYLWSVDATGSVVRGVGTDKNSGLIQEIFSFTY